MRRAVALGLGVLFISGCDFVLWRPPSGETGSANLKSFSSEAEFQQYFTGQVEQRGELVSEPGGLTNFDDGDVAAAPGGAGGEADPAMPPPRSDSSDAGADAPHSGTTTQEQGVDEADVVKTDGTYLYIVGEQKLRIVRVMPPEDMALVAEVEVEGYPRDLYLHGDRVIALTETYGNIVFADGEGVGGQPEPLASDASTGSSDGVDGASPPPDEDDAIGDQPAPDVFDEAPPFHYTRPQTNVIILDVTERSTPSVVAEVSFDGTQAASRMIDGVLHLVLANYQNYYFDVMPMMSRPGLFAPPEIDTEEILPTYRRRLADGTQSEGPVLTWRELYRPTDPDGFGVVSVITMDAGADRGEFAAVGVVAEPGLIYSSPTALYLTDTNYDFFGEARETTDIYKFAYDGSQAARPIATGSVPGRILNQYSMGEYQDHLRVATTVGPTFSPFGERSGPFNNLYVLGEREGALKVTGSIENIAPGETIQSARFIGPRGFLVTFEQIDPLFTLDLADPAAPRVVGELKVPGFSTFIVPMDADHLLTVGQYVPETGPTWPQGVQLSIFDITDFANPTLKHLEVLTSESGGAWSEAVSNPKAFTYFPEQEVVSLPISMYGWSFVDVDPAQVDGPGSDDAGQAEGSGEVWVPEGFEGLLVYHVTPDAGFEPMGRISTRFDEAGYYYYPWFTRGIFIADHVFAASNVGVRGASMEDVSAAPYELMLAEPVDGWPSDPPDDDVVLPDEPVTRPGEPEPARP